MKTKERAFVLLFLFCSFFLSVNSYGQLTLEMGNDTTYCSDQNTTAIPMGIKVDIKNGVEPYTYAWECKIVPYVELKPQTASDVLNDSTLLAPTFIDGVWFYADTIKFILHVTDHVGNYAKDSLNLRFISYACILGYQVIELAQGDSVWLDAGEPSGSVAAYYWEPSDGLSTPRSSASWFKPTVTTDYSIVRVDTSGCIGSCHAYQIRVIPTSSDPKHFNPIANGKKVSWIVKNEIWDRAIIDTLYLSDTINIDSKKYWEVIYSSERFNKNNNIVGYFREDTISGKAWFQGYLDSTEYLIMDLSLKKGDSIYVKMVYGNKYAHIINDEIVEGRKVLTTDYHYGGGFISENLKFIEGVGPNASIMYQIDSSTAVEINQKFGYLICKQYNDSKLVYAWDTINYDCGLLWNNIDEITNNQVLIYPNPATNILYINCSSTKEENGVIIDCQGVEMSSFQIQSNFKELNISHYPKGIYFIQIGSNASKFVKQ